MDALLIASQALHVISAAILVGGAFFFRLLLHKYAQREGGLDDALRATLVKRWLHLAWNLIIVLVVTGLFQLSQSMAAWKGSSAHMIFGMKFLVFLAVVIVLALATTAHGPRAPKRPAYFLINVILGIVILALSAWLRRSY